MSKAFRAAFHRLVHRCLPRAVWRWLRHAQGQRAESIALGLHLGDGCPGLEGHATLTKIPGVLTAFHVAGEDDYLVHVATTSPEELRDLVLNHINVNREVRQTETQLVFSVLPGAGVPFETRTAVSKM